MVSFLEIVASLADSRAVLTTAKVAVWVHQLVDLRVAIVLRWYHGDRKFPLCAISSLHNLADSESAVMSWNVGLLTIS